MTKVEAYLVSRVSPWLFSGQLMMIEMIVCAAELQAELYHTADELLMVCSEPTLRNC